MDTEADSQRRWGRGQQKAVGPGRAGTIAGHLQAAGQALRAVPVTSSTVNIFGSVGHMAPVETVRSALLGQRPFPTAVSGYGCVLTKLILYKLGNVNAISLRHITESHFLYIFVKAI